MEIRSLCPGLVFLKQGCRQIHQINLEVLLEGLHTHPVDRLTSHDMMIGAEWNALLVTATSTASLHMMRVYWEAIAH